MTADETAGSDQRRPMIVLIEPNGAIAQVLARALAQESYAVTTVAEAERGAARAKALRAALVVMDVRGGDAAFAQARAVSSIAGAPVLAMSAHGKTINAFEDAGWPLLRKPFAIMALLEAVRAALQAAAPRAGLQLLSVLSWSSASIL